MSSQRTVRPRACLGYRCNTTGASCGPLMDVVNANEIAQLPPPVPAADKAAANTPPASLPEMQQAPLPSNALFSQRLAFEGAMELVLTRQADDLQQEQALLVWSQIIDLWTLCSEGLIGEPVKFGEYLPIVETAGNLEDSNWRVAPEQVPSGGIIHGDLIVEQDATGAYTLARLPHRKRKSPVHITGMGPRRYPPPQRGQIHVQSHDHSTGVALERVGLEADKITSERLDTVLLEAKLFKMTGLTLSDLNFKDMLGVVQSSAGSAVPPACAPSARTTTFDLHATIGPSEDSYLELRASDRKSVDAQLEAVTKQNSAVEHDAPDPNPGAGAVAALQDLDPTDLVSRSRAKGQGLLRQAIVQALQRGSQHQDLTIRSTYLSQRMSLPHTLLQAPHGMVYLDEQDFMDLLDVISERKASDDSWGPETEADNGSVAPTARKLTPSEQWAMLVVSAVVERLGYILSRDAMMDCAVKASLDTIGEVNTFEEHVSRQVVELQARNHSAVHADIIARERVSETVLKSRVSRLVVHASYHVMVNMLAASSSSGRVMVDKLHKDLRHMFSLRNALASEPPSVVAYTAHVVRQMVTVGTMPLQWDRTVTLVADQLRERAQRDKVSRRLSITRLEKMMSSVLPPSLLPDAHGQDLDRFRETSGRGRAAAMMPATAPLLKPSSSELRVPNRFRSGIVVGRIESLSREEEQAMPDKQSSSQPAGETSPLVHSLMRSPGFSASFCHTVLPMLHVVLKCDPLPAWASSLLSTVSGDALKGVHAVREQSLTLPMDFKREAVTSVSGFLVALERQLPAAMDIVSVLVKALRPAEVSDKVLRHTMVLNQVDTEFEEGGQAESGEDALDDEGYDVGENPVD